MTNDDLSLFGDDHPEHRAPVPAEPAALADWQLSQLRSALDGCGVSDMTQRQQLVEELVGRSVDSLRDLTSTEARSLLEQLHARAGERSQPSGSSWDAREEHTWIDRL